jgi:hypothetical protein
MTASDRLVDTERGGVSREILVNDYISAEKQEKLFARTGRLSGMRARSPSRAIVRPGF